MSDANMHLAAIPTWVPGAPIASIAKACALAFKILTNRANVDVVHVHLSERGSFVREGAVVISAKARSIPVVATIHGADFSTFAQRSPRLVRRILRCVNHVIVLGPDHRRQVAELVPEVPTTIVRNPVDVPKGDRPPQVEPFALFAGEVSARKGFDRLAKAWRRVEENVDAPRLTVCGPIGDIDPSIEIPSATYHGEVKRDYARNLMARASIVCLPSRREVLPMAILEAVASGTHVVAARAGEYLSFEGCPNITWVDNDDHDESIRQLAEAIIDRLSTEPDIESSLQGRQWVLENASTESVRYQLLDVYNSVRMK